MRLVDNQLRLGLRSHLKGAEGLHVAVAGTENEVAGARGIAEASDGRVKILVELQNIANKESERIAEAALLQQAY